MARRRVHMTFPGEIADEPVLWQLAQRYHLMYNIRQADYAQGVGWMMAELEGEGPDLDAGIAWLESRGVQVAPIEQDVVQW